MNEDEQTREAREPTEAQVAVATQVDWSRTWNRWVVSAPFAGGWTLVGLFTEARAAFRAARLAARRLAPGGAGETPTAHRA